MAASVSNPPGGSCVKGLGKPGLETQSLCDWKTISRQFVWMVAPNLKGGDRFPFGNPLLPLTARASQCAAMFSHVVIFWTDPDNPNAADTLLEGANRFLKPIPGVIHFHAGKMASSHRPVVDQTYQVALNIIFTDKKAQDDYQVHPLHLRFVEEVFKKVCTKVVVYDFQ